LAHEFVDALGKTLGGFSVSSGFHGHRRANQQSDFSTRGAFLKRENKFGEAGVAEFFVELGDFACEAGVAVAENFERVRDGLRNAVRSFVENDGAVFDTEALEGATAFSATIGKKSYKKKFFVGKARGGKGSEKGGRPGDGDNRDVMAETKGDESMAGIGNEWHAGVADESDLGALLEGQDEFRRAGDFVVFVIADERAMNVVVSEKFLRVAGVFASDLVDFFQDAQGT
jgi:hypothetical protein